MIDGHVHLNINSNTPFFDLVREIDKNNIDGCLLILNDELEKIAFDNEYEIYQNNINRICVAVGINPRQKKTIDYARNFYSHINKKRIAKVHPRLMEITVDDFAKINEIIKELKIDTLIIDTLVYGSKYKYNNGVELGVFLAEENPDSNIVLAHAGSTHILDTIMITRWTKNIYYDISFICPFFLQMSIKQDISYLIKRTDQRVIYGSDYPSFDLHNTYKAFENLANESGLTNDQFDNISFKNAMNLYGIII